MAIIDGERDEIVVRILYDGPALAGKTTSIKSLLTVLAAKRRSDFFTPGEAEGRTLYFDWMDYLGGWCDGRQVRCQIVSAPGQRSLLGRRKLLLRDADVVVFVAESTADGAAAAEASYAELKDILAEREGPIVPIVMQANKQDLPGALDIDSLRERFSDETQLAIIGSAAPDGTGVREAFTFGVRLALDRVRELTKRGMLPVGEPEIRSGEDLLNWLESEEAATTAIESPTPADFEAPAPDVGPAHSSNPQDAGETESADAELQQEPDLEQESLQEIPVEKDESSVAVTEDELPPCLPNSGAPSGLVWRPMEGRIILHQLEGAESQIRREPDGRWIAIVARRWFLASEKHEVYRDVEEGRRDLLEAARFHNFLGTLLSEHRALTLSESGDGHWRLWRIARREASLRDRLRAVLKRLDSEGARELFEIADALIRMTEQLAEVEGAPQATLRTIGERDGRLNFVGIVPDARGPHETASSTLSHESLVRAAFAPYFEDPGQERQVDAPAALSRLRTLHRDRPERSGVIEALAAILIGK